MYVGDICVLLSVHWYQKLWSILVWLLRCMLVGVLTQIFTIRKIFDNELFHKKLGTAGLRIHSHTLRDMFENDKNNTWWVQQQEYPFLSLSPDYHPQQQPYKFTLTLIFLLLACNSLEDITVGIEHVCSEKFGGNFHSKIIL